MVPGASQMPGDEVPTHLGDVGRLLRLRLGDLQIRLGSPGPFPASWFLEHSWEGRQPEIEQPAYSIFLPSTTATVMR